MILIYQPMYSNTIQMIKSIGNLIYIVITIIIYFGNIYDKNDFNPIIIIMISVPMTVHIA